MSVIKYVVASHLTEEAKNKLENENITVIELPENSALDERVRYHSDLSCLYLGKKNVCIASELSSKKDFFSDMGFRVFLCEREMGRNYPYDVPLNCVDTGKYLICNIDTVSDFVLQYFKRQGRTVVGVNQGYTNCSVITLNESAIITDDESIAEASGKSGIDVLKIQKGFVELEGFGYGFIGGASGRISESVIAFNGNAALHPDYEKIVRFLGKYAMKVLSLADEQLKDIGGIVPLY